MNDGCPVTGVGCKKLEDLQGKKAGCIMIVVGCIKVKIKRITKTSDTGHLISNI